MLYQYNFPTHIQENLIIDIMSSNPKMKMKIMALGKFEIQVLCVLHPEDNVFHIVASSY